MTTDRTNTDPDDALRRAVRRYVVARETPGVASERAYQDMRHAARRARQAVKAEQQEIN
ncbi:MAG: hypothetical protein U5L06_00785 [Rhodovibrio sp.]|nr:hypothetical protein [Rhodovibrio sp.]